MDGCNIQKIQHYNYDYDYGYDYWKDYHWAQVHALINDKCHLHATAKVTCYDGTWKIGGKIELFHHVIKVT